MNNKYYSNKQESAIASALGWQQVTGSGARHLYPGDISGIDWLGECKTHTKPNQKISFIWTVWNKIGDEAASRAKYPVLFVDDGSQKLENTWCMIPEHVDISEIDNTIPIVDYPKTLQKSVTFDSKSLCKDNIHYCIGKNNTGYIMHFDMFMRLFT